MQKLMMLTLLLGLAACASSYGNYGKNSDVNNAKMAEDSANELALLYPPAFTHFTLSQTVDDAYGTELVKKLRVKGYAVEEGSGFDLSSNIATFSHTFKNVDLSSPVAAASSSNSIGYIVDPIGDDLHRVEISIGSKTLSRVYRLSSNLIIPAGSWSLKE
jgi:hypothetical protein